MVLSLVSPGANVELTLKEKVVEYWMDLNGLLTLRFNLEDSAFDRIRLSTGGLVEFHGFSTSEGDFHGIRMEHF